MERALKHYPVAEVSGHFHDTYGQAIGNVYASLEVGIATFDASVAGLGGCPYAKGATGNVATEDVLFLLDGLGIDTGVSIDGVVDAAAFISAVLGRKPVSRSGNALLAKRAAADADAQVRARHRGSDLSSPGRGRRISGDCSAAALVQPTWRRRRSTPAAPRRILAAVALKHRPPIVVGVEPERSAAAASGATARLRCPRAAIDV